MSARALLLSLICVSTLSAQQAALQPVSLVSVQRAGANTPPTAADFSSAAKLLKSDSENSYAIAAGRTTLIVSVPKIESVGSVSFINSGATGHVSVFVSPTKLTAQSNRWQLVASQRLTNGAIEALVRPNDARYVKLTFDIAQKGELSRLGVSARSTIASYALLATDSAGIESDGKTVVDGKDLGEAKDIPSEGEAPAEGPPPGLPDPPPFTFVPVLVPTSP